MISSLNPENGELYWEVPYEATSGSVIMAPIQIDDYLYFAGYSKKSLLLKLATDKPVAEVVWRDKVGQAISPVNVQPFYEKKAKLIFGLDQSGELAALAIPSGKRLWASADPVGKRRIGNGTAFIVQQADRYWLFNESGELIIAKLSRDGHQEIDGVKVIEPSNNAFGRKVVWSMPAFANRRAYIRNDDEIICLDLGKK